MKVFIAADHRGLDFEEKIKKYLLTKGYDVITSKIPHNDTDDYPDFAIELGLNVSKNHNSFGILICRTGIGMSIAANKVKGVRAACCHSKMDAYLTRNDNDANVLCISYELDDKNLFEIIDTFLNTNAFDSDRHKRRVDKIIKYENGEYNEL